MSAALQPERWRRLRPLLDQALDLQGSARQDFVAALARESAELAADLQRLLDLHERETGLDQPAAGLVGNVLQGPRPAANDRHVNRRIGPWVLRKLVGSGGMGAVYEGERVEGGFRQRVAVKLIGGVHPGLHERFARERQILAELRHPNIPQLFDGGETDDGMPYLVQEFIDGRSIIEHADACVADLDTRLDLLVKVGEALAYAHRRKVLHRDIKPSNILVAADGAVKLLDFGIAKLLDDTGQPTLTKQLLGPMTPDYAAPEQFRGEALSAATDIYQFGVLAFRLLAGRSPYRVDTADAMAFGRAVCDEPPLGLLAVLDEDGVLDRLGGTGGSGRRRSLKQRWTDLDRILRRCLAKRPGDRYSVMEALIADLEAVRDDAVPQARRGFDGRRRVRHAAMAAAALLLLAALGGWLRFGLPWSTDPFADTILVGLGLDASNIHGEQSDTPALLQQALATEARGDVASSIVLLENLHRHDARTPIPAMLLGYWTRVHGDEATMKAWQGRAAERLRALDDPRVDLVQRMIIADSGGNYDETLRVSAAILELSPDAWFLRLARSHLLNLRGLRTAAVRELQQIAPSSLAHRKLVDAVADRASMGDVAGAEALAERLADTVGTATYAMLQARLAYSRGDLDGARRHFRESVELARAEAHLDVEARGLLLLGITEGAAGDYRAAAVALRAARQRLAARLRYGDAADALICLAQIEALQGNLDGARRELQAARGILRDRGSRLADPHVELMAARMFGEARPDAAHFPEDARALLAARRALIAGDLDTARRQLDIADELGADESYFVEELALLRRELGQPEPALAPIDPPFGPFTRYAARWALGAGPSILPPSR